MQFGVFDHMDRGAVPLDRFYADRLRLVEAYPGAAIASGATAFCCYGASTTCSFPNQMRCFPSSSRKRRHRAVQTSIDEGGLNYLLCRFAFGDIMCDEALQSVELFDRHVQPAITPAR
jgi:hypothetical protein